MGWSRFEPSSAPGLALKHESPLRVIGSSRDWFAWLADCPKPLGRVGVWIEGGLPQALLARRLVAAIQRHEPGVEVFLLGARACASFFEMDDKAHFMPVDLLETPRSGQSRLGRWLAHRIECKRLRTLGLDACLVLPRDLKQNSKTLTQPMHTLKIGHAALFVAAWPTVQGNLDFGAPVLQAGPQALVDANRLYRLGPPNRLKVLLVLVDGAGTLADLLEQKERVWLGLCTSRPELAQAFCTWVVVLGGDRFRNRQVQNALPNAVPVGWSQAVGHVAYADWVVSCDSLLTLICHEMGRDSQLLLIK